MKAGVGIAIVLALVALAAAGGDDEPAKAPPKDDAPPPDDQKDERTAELQKADEKVANVLATGADDPARFALDTVDALKGTMGAPWAAEMVELIMRIGGIVQGSANPAALPALLESVREHGFPMTADVLQTLADARSPAPNSPALQDADLVIAKAIGVDTRTFYDPVARELLDGLRPEMGQQWFESLDMAFQNANRAVQGIDDSKHEFLVATAAIKTGGFPRTSETLRGLGVVPL